MKMRLPKKDRPSISVSVEGKSYSVDKEGSVELPNSTPAGTIRHLISMGWQIADDAAKKKVEEAGIVLGPDGQPKQ